MKHYEGLGSLLQESDAKDWYDVFWWEVVDFPQSWPWFCCDTGTSWSLELAQLPGSTTNNLTLTSMTSTSKAAAYSPSCILETATLEALKCICEHMFLLQTSGTYGWPFLATPRRSPARGARAVHHTASPESPHRHTQHPYYMGVGPVLPGDSVCVVSPC